MSQAERAERHTKMAALVAAGTSTADVAAQFGVCPRTVRTACLNRTAVRHLEPPFVRSVHDTWDAPEWAGICLWHRACADACRRPGTWQNAAWRESQVMACDEHHGELGCRVRVRRRQEAG